MPRAVVRGWTVSGIASFRSGTPFNVTSGRDNNLDGVNTDRANLVGIPFLDPHRSRSDVTNAWFNTAAFAQNAAGQVGNRGGLQMMAVYTWSKILDDFSSVGGYGQSYPGYTDHNKRFLDKSLSSLDVAHRLVFNYEYDLPLRPAGRLLKTLIGGWNINGGTSIQSGMPIPILSFANTTFSQGGAQRPNSTGKSSRTPGGDKDRIDHWFDNTAFVNPPRYTFGNVGRTLPDNRGPALQSWEFSVLKNIPIRESKRLEFRAEFFNAFNNVNFLPPEAAAADFGRPQFGTLTSRSVSPASYNLD